MVILNFEKEIAHFDNVSYKNHYFRGFLHKTLNYKHHFQGQQTELSQTELSINNVEPKQGHTDEDGQEESVHCASRKHNEAS